MDASTNDNNDDPGASDEENRVEQRARDLEQIATLSTTHAGSKPTSIEAVPAGLGTRRFYRIRFATGEYASLIARIESDETAAAPSTRSLNPAQPPAWLPEPRLEPLRQFLEDAGLRVPRSIAHRPDLGIDLLEDVGDRTLKAVDRPEDRATFYREACDIVPRLQRLSSTADRIPAFGRFFDRALIETKAWKWLHWTIPGLLDRPASDEEAASLRSIFEAIAVLLDAAPRRLSHRDFKAENLHLVAQPDRPDAKREVVMIDVQGAFMAPPEYDLVCLLYDLQVDLDESFVMDLLRATLPRLPDTAEGTPADAARSEETAMIRFDALATLRLCKDISHLVQAGRGRDDFRRWHEIPRGLTLLERAAGRLTRTFPEIQDLNSVIHALTLAVGPSDSRQQSS